jgi:hypothetical protein
MFDHLDHDFTNRQCRATRHLDALRDGGWNPHVRLKIRPHKDQSRARRSRTEFDAYVDPTPQTKARDGCDLADCALSSQ